MWQETAALRDFNPAYVRVGSKAEKLTLSICCPLLPQLRTFVGYVATGGPLRHAA